MDLNWGIHHNADLKIQFRLAHMGIIDNFFTI